LDDRVELFKITCVTCRARLSVRDEALVGQIIGCPRCGMMVQVAPPPGAQQAALVATTVVAAAVPGALQTAPVAVESNTALPDTATLPALSAEHAAEFADAADAATSDVSISAAPTAPPPVTAATVASGWTSYQFMAIVGVGAIAGSAIVAAALTWFGKNEQPAVASPGPSDAATPLAPTAPAHSEQEVAPIATADDLAMPPQAADEPEEAFLPIEEPAPIALVTAGPVAVEQAELPTAAVEPPTPIVDEPSTPLASDAASEKPAAAPRLRIDPLDMDPEGLDLSTLYQGPQKDPLAESQLPKEELTVSSAPPRVPDVAPEVPAATEQLVRRDMRAGVGAPTAIQTVLARRLPGMKVNKMPLCRLLDLSVQISGIPVSVAPQELRMAAVAAATPASTNAKDVTIEQLLAAALQPLRLKPMVEGQQILLKRIGEDSRRTVEYAVDDLAGAPDKVKQLADWITQLAAPDAWQTRGGDATLTAEGAKLRVDAPVAVQYEVLFVLERYRLTRGLPMRTKYPSDLLSAGAYQASIAERLSAPAVFTFSQYAPLREFFRYWQEELEVAVLVDWPALADERLWPQTRIACSAADKSWAEAMDSVLGPLGLAWRAVDHRTVEITTLTKVDAEPQLDVYRVAENASVDAAELSARIQALSGNSQPAAAVAYDAESRVLLVRQPAAAHRRMVAEMGDVLEQTAGNSTAR
jgi:hypothetical protein